jgi:hypothetical protein
MNQEENKHRLEDNCNLLAGVSSQIASFDNKAGILISVIGIVFALSLSLVDVVPLLKGNQTDYIVFCVFFVLSLVSSITSIVFSLLVVIPRENKQKKINVNYYRDLDGMSFDDFRKDKLAFTDDEEVMFNQIKTNAHICNRKHHFLKLSIFSLIPLGIFLLTTVILALAFSA